MGLFNWLWSWSIRASGIKLRLRTQLALFLQYRCFDIPSKKKGALTFFLIILQSNLIINTII